MSDGWPTFSLSRRCKRAPPLWRFSLVVSAPSTRELPSLALPPPHCLIDRRIARAGESTIEFPCPTPGPWPTRISTRTCDQALQRRGIAGIRVCAVPLYNQPKGSLPVRVLMRQLGYTPARRNNSPECSAASLQAPAHRRQHHHQQPADELGALVSPLGGRRWQKVCDAREIMTLLNGHVARQCFPVGAGQHRRHPRRAQSTVSFES